MKDKDQEKIHILLIDDDEILTSVLSRALERRGYSAIQANSAESAMKIVREQRVDKAVVDLKIAEESGLQLIPKLIHEQPSIKIVMLTGYSSIATAVEAMKMGAKNYLCKPADADQIIKSFDGTAPEINENVEHVPPSVERLEWEHIQKVMQENDNNVSASARALGMHRRTLQRKLQKRPVKR